MVNDFENRTDIPILTDSFVQSHFEMNEFKMQEFNSSIFCVYFEHNILLGL